MEPHTRQLGFVQQLPETSAEVASLDGRPDGRREHQPCFVPTLPCEEALFRLHGPVVKQRLDPDARQGNRATALASLGFHQPQRAADALQPMPNVKTSAGEVDVLPREAESLALAQTQG